MNYIKDMEINEKFLKDYLHAQVLVKKANGELKGTIDLSWSEYIVLKMLSKDGFSQNVLVEMTGLSPAGVSKIIFSLKSKKLICEGGKDTDRRKNFIKISLLGEKKIKLADTLLESILN